VPFARLDSILLLVKKHLKGKIPDMLNAKDNQVFLDYLAGGQSRQIAVERAANAQSKGVLSVAARNIEGVPTEAPAPVAMTGEQIALIREARQELESIQALAGSLGGVPGSLQEIKKGLADIEETKIHYAQKGHEQKLRHAEELQAFEVKKIEDLQALELKKIEDLQALELKKQEFEVKKRKQNLEMDQEEAEVAERCRAIREGRKLVLSTGGRANCVRPVEDEDEVTGSAGAGEDVFSLSQGSDEYHHGLKYDNAVEAGMDEEAIAERRALWQQLTAMSADDQTRWQPLANELVVSTAMMLYDTQLKERLGRYEAMKWVEEDSANAQRRAYLSKV